MNTVVIRGIYKSLAVNITSKNRHGRELTRGAHNLGEPCQSWKQCRRSISLTVDGVKYENETELG
jgi:hypothetical protein